MCDYDTRALIFVPVFYGLFNDPLTEFYHVFGSHPTVITLSASCGPHICRKRLRGRMRDHDTFQDCITVSRFMAHFSSDDDDGVTEGQEEESHEDEDDAAAHVNHTRSVSEATEATVQATTPLLLDDGAAITLSTPENPGTY